VFVILVPSTPLFRSGWRRRRPVVLRVNSLVPVFILQFMGNIRRKRHFSKLIQDFFKNTVILKPDQAVAFIYNIQDLSLQDPVSKSDPGSWSRFLPRLHQALPGIVIFTYL